MLLCLIPWATDEHGWAWRTLTVDWFGDNWAALILGLDRSGLLIRIGPLQVAWGTHYRYCETDN